MTITKISIPILVQGEVIHMDYFFRTPHKSPSKANVIEKISEEVDAEAVETLNNYSNWRYVSPDSPKVVNPIKLGDVKTHISWEVIKIIDVIPQ
jgi:hypothetical protein